MQSDAVATLKDEVGDHEVYYQQLIWSWFTMLDPFNRKLYDSHTFRAVSPIKPNCQLGGLSEWIPESLG